MMVRYHHIWISFNSYRQFCNHVPMKWVITDWCSIFHYYSIIIWWRVLSNAGVQQPSSNRFSLLMSSYVADSVQAIGDFIEQTITVVPGIFYYRTGGSLCLNIQFSIAIQDLMQRKSFRLKLSFHFQSDDDCSDSSWSGRDRYSWRSMKMDLIYEPVK